MRHIGHVSGFAQLNKLIAERGPYYAISGTIRAREFCVVYADTAEQAERWFENYQENHYRQIKVDPPEGSIDLTKLGKDRADAKHALEVKTDILRVGVLRALEVNPDRNESELARQAGVDRMTVRTWAGK